MQLVVSTYRRLPRVTFQEGRQSHEPTACLCALLTSDYLPAYLPLELSNLGTFCAYAPKLFLHTVYETVCGRAKLPGFPGHRPVAATSAASVVNPVKADRLWNTPPTPFPLRDRERDTPQHGVMGSWPSRSETPDDRSRSPPLLGDASYSPLAHACPAFCRCLHLPLCMWWSQGPSGTVKIFLEFFFSSCETPPLDRAPLARDWIERPLHENKSGVTWSSTSGTLSDQPEASEPLRNCVTVPYGPEGASMPNSQSFRSIIFLAYSPAALPPGPLAYPEHRGPIIARHGLVGKKRTQGCATLGCSGRAFFVIDH